MKTEEEARKCWCPFARVGNKEGCNRYSFDTDLFDGHAFARCIASECMAFCWIPDAEVPQDSLILDQGDERFSIGVWWDGRYWKTNDERLHRLIAVDAFGDIPPNMVVDHIDGDTNNNRRGNLRIVTKQQNATNAASRGGESSYRGVSKARSGKWVAQISSNGVRKCLGTFESEDDAAAAYDDAARRLHGEHGRLNLEKRSNSGRRGYCGLAGKP